MPLLHSSVRSPLITIICKMYGRTTPITVVDYYKDFLLIQNTTITITLIQIESIYPDLNFAIFQEEETCKASFASSKLKHDIQGIIIKAEFNMIVLQRIINGSNVYLSKHYIYWCVLKIIIYQGYEQNIIPSVQMLFLNFLSPTILDLKRY